MNEAWHKREQVLPLPDGVPKALLLGTTGAGKTTLLRQLIGTDPEVERFPSTSTSRTTIHDIEIIVAPDQVFKGVVTFIPEKQARALIEECVQDAVIAYITTGKKHNLMNRFLEHRDSRFRLGYLVGKPIGDEEKESLELELDLETEELDAETESGEVEYVRSESIQEQLVKFEKGLISLADSLKEEISGRFHHNVNLEDKQEENDAFESLLGESFQEDHPRFIEFVDEVLDVVKAKFKLIEKGILDTNVASGWPESWKFESVDRKEFIQQVNQFSSNYAPNFGRLLTPLVDGVRVRGPFISRFFKSQPTMVFLDGEGLGHTTETTASLPGTVTEKIDLVDTILLVDNAQQPMLSAPQVVMRSTAGSGNESKLLLSFTHFEEVKGENFRTVRDRQDHIINTTENFLSKVGQEVSRDAQRSLRKVMEDGVFYLAGIQNKKLPKLTVNELVRLATTILAKTEKLPSSTASLSFDSGFLENHLTKAIKTFHMDWKDILGLSYNPRLPKRHWATIKAFSRRLSEFGQTEYYDLRPIADLGDLLAINLRRFLSSSLIQTVKDLDDSDILILIQKIAQRIRQEINTYIQEKLYVEQQENWEIAYEFRGAGSSRQRAYTIVNIYEIGTLNPDEDLPLMESNRFVDRLKQIVTEAIEEYGCQLI